MEHSDINIFAQKFKKKVTTITQCIISTTPDNT